MKAVGIIAEYNPFHNGHKYQIKQAKEETAADFAVIAMSGDFVQRGQPAIMDKHTRAKAALSSGADLVLELPVTAACASAEYFAAAAVELLGKTGVVDVICYGCESQNEDLMSHLVSALNEESACFSHMISGHLKKGCSYPKARQEALCEFLPEWDDEEIADFISSPNNILALEYERAIARWNQGHSHKLCGHPILRVGEGYYSTDVRAEFISATAVRQKVFRTPAPFLLYAVLGARVPYASLSSLVNAKRRSQLAGPEAFSPALFQRLLSLQETGYENFADCSPSLSGRIQNNLWQYLGFCSFATLLNSRELTYGRICRVLFHILLNITNGDYEQIKNGNGILYLRMLGFRKEASPLLSAISKKASVPLLSKVADADRILNDNAMKQFGKDLYAAELYRGIISAQCHEVLSNEYTTELVIIP